MSLDAATRARIDELLTRNRVVLFMKGTRDAPRCGFSAKAVSLIRDLAPGFVSVDVLADEAIRSGIKVYGNWPTIPQLYVDRELIGGSDIIQGMVASGELHQLLGVAAPDRTPPAIRITTKAAEAIRSGMDDADGLALHLGIDDRWQARFELAEASGHEIVAEDAGIRILMDPMTARRAEGMEIDWQESFQGGGLSIRLPQAPPPVRSIDVETLDQRIEAGTAPLVIDIRPEADRARAPFPEAHEVLDGNTLKALEALPKDRPLAFLCHFGNSSRQAAEHFRNLGFREVYNIEGGIDAWSRQIDAEVPRY